MLVQVISVLGALGILGAFMANTFRWVSRDYLSYHVINLIGAGMLTFVAIVEQQLGFILLEGAWALISLWGMIKVLRGQTPE